MNRTNYEALAEFRYFLRKFLRFSKDFLRERARISPEQYEALLAIKAFVEPEKLTISQLSARLQVKHHSTVSIVNRLAERNLITRKAGASDRRERYLALTAKGRQLIQELARLHQREIRNLAPAIIEALERLNRGGGKHN